MLHAGTGRGRRGHVVTSGGRVLGVVGLGATIEEAGTRAYAACRASGGRACTTAPISLPRWLTGRPAPDRAKAPETQEVR